MIWLIGNKGMLGRDVEGLLREKGWEYLGTDKEVDITDYGVIDGFVAKNVGNRNVKWVINCSAYTAVDRAEDEHEMAFKINAEGVENIAKIVKDLGAVLIHISTDYVYDGKKEDVYLETDRPNPIGVYGKSKLEGEERIKKFLDKYFIIRTAWLYGRNGNNFVYTMLNLFKEKDVVKVVSDQWGSPTYTKDLARAIIKFVEVSPNSYGIYHFTNEGKTNWFEFAKKIYEYAQMYDLIKREVRIVPITTEQYPTKAERPHNSYLSKEKIKQTLGLEIPKWEDSLKNFMEELV